MNEPDMHSTLYEDEKTVHIAQAIGDQSIEYVCSNCSQVFKGMRECDVTRRHYFPFGTRRTFSGK